LRGGVSVDDVELIGDSDADRTMPSGLWPSDHAGLIATFNIPERSITVPEASTWVMMVLGFAGLGLARHFRQSARIR
jgi:hypothetical protein